MLCRNSITVSFCWIKMKWGVSVCAACGTWLANTHMLVNVAVVVKDRFDLSTKEECWDACEENSDCNAVSWRANNTGCHLRRVPEDQAGTTDSSYESLRACEPGSSTIHPIFIAHLSLGMTAPLDIKVGLEFIRLPLAAFRAAENHRAAPQAESRIYNTVSHSIPYRHTFSMLSELKSALYLKVLCSV